MIRHSDQAYLQSKYNCETISITNLNVYVRLHRQSMSFCFAKKFVHNSLKNLTCTRRNENREFLISRNNNRFNSREHRENTQL